MAGNTNVSSLMRAALSARKAKEAYQDDVVTYTWSMSAKTADDYAIYADHLKARAETATGTQQLSYLRSVDTARRTFTSSEIQRQSMAINEGAGDLQGKQNRIIELYNEAADNGDAGLVQDLRAQYDTIDKQIQSEAEAQANRDQANAAKMSSYNVTSAKQLATALTSGEDPTYTNWSLKMLSDAFAQKGLKWADEQSFTDPATGQQMNFWDYASSLTDQIAGAYDMAAGYADDANTAFTNTEAANKIRNGETTFKFMGKSLTANDIFDARDAAAAGQQLFSVMKNADGKYELTTAGEGGKATNVNGYMWGRTADGTYRMIKTRSTYGDKKDVSQQAENLKKAGFDVIKTDGQNGNLVVRANGNFKGNIPGLRAGDAFTVNFDSQGDARFVSEADSATGVPKIYQINLSGRPEIFGEVRKVEGIEDTAGRDQMDSLLDQGASYEKIAKVTGSDVADIRDYTDSTRPGYGMPSQKTQSAFGVKSSANDNSPMSAVGSLTSSGLTSSLPKIGETNVGPQQTALQRNLAAVNKGLDKGMSYEDLSRQTGVALNDIRTFADKSRPGYGIKSPVSAPALKSSAPMANAIAKPTFGAAPRVAAPTPRATPLPYGVAAPKQTTKAPAKKQSQWWNPFSW